MRSGKRSLAALWLTSAPVALLCAASVSAQTAHLTLNSQPGDFIGQGQTYDFTYTPANTAAGGLFANYYFGSPPNFLDFEFFTPDPLPNRLTTLDFATKQLGVPMAVGTYTNAQLASVAAPGHPGLDVTFQNRGCNTLTGSFTVTDIAFLATGSNLVLDRFSATFEQHCEGAAPALFGTFTYLRDPAAVPEPGTLPLWVAGGLSGVGLLLRRKHA